MYKPKYNHFDEAQLARTLQEAKMASLKVELLSIHKKGPEIRDWKKLLDRPAPPKPKRTTEAESLIRKKIADRSPTGLRYALLKTRLQKAIRQDERTFRRATKDYEEKYRRWEDEHDYADKMCNEHPDFYAKLLKEKSANFYDGLIPCELDTNINVRILKTGERRLIFTTNMTIKWEVLGTISFIPDDDLIIAGLALRTGRNSFAEYPADLVFLNYWDKEVIPRSGHEKRVCRLSVAFPRELFLSLNFDRLDPVESMENFEHRIDDDEPLDYEKTLLKILE
jgi:hypothetical protein